MSDHIQTLADLLRSNDPANHIVAATIASDDDFIAAVQVLVDKAAEILKDGIPLGIDILVSTKINLKVYPHEERQVQLVSYLDSKYMEMTEPATWHPDTACAALHLKKLLLCEQ